MTTYEATASYKVIYVFSIDDPDHKGFLKIGDATLKSPLSKNQLPPCCELLNEAAEKRIKKYTKTAMTSYELLYTELAVRTVRLQDETIIEQSFRDKHVHEVLDRSGFFVRRFNDSGRPSEWYKIDLQIAKSAINAAKEGRTFLSESEKNSDSNKQGHAVSPKITLRAEQIAAIAKTKKEFQSGNTMLWDCKMRFGKTVAACELTKEMQFQKTIVVTHRPVVADGWEKDYHLIFGDSDDHVFQTKIKGGTEVDFDARIDAENARTLRNLSQTQRCFLYFASMQDLRGSERVKEGGFKKNDAVFDMDWDFIIYDEAHEGTQTDLGQSVQKELESPKNGKTPKVLSLSGTPYNLLGQYENNVYSWDYVMEQKAKKDWEDNTPGIPNPYADLPEMRILTFDLRENIPSSYRYETEDMAFNFREFFRTWTGDPREDFRQIPEDAKVGDFVHEADIKSFLNLITTDSKDSNYPFSTDERRRMFKHTFWMVPGVKEARALSKLLKVHPVFMHYGIANVAGNGDEEEAYEDALRKVREVIKANEFSIT